jgi:transcriptional regulator with XRE-family HTH domain
MNHDQVARHVASNVTALRRQRGWSAAELARRAGVDAGTIQNVEAGGNATLATLTALASAFELPLRSVLLDGSPDEVPPLTVRPAGEREEVDLGDRTLTALASVPRARDVQLALVRFRSGREHRAVGHVDGLVERLYVLEGRLEVGLLTPQGEVRPAHPGDLVTVRADLPRRYLAVGGDVLAVLLTSGEGPAAH